jgi:SAM-dependent methyltransferase
MSSGVEPHDQLGSTYDAEFYEELDAQVRGSAEVIVPIVVELLRPSAVLDVGCGRGTWLRVFARCGVEQIVGLDGRHISADDLEIPADAFVGCDLTQPFDLGRRFDLAVSLEVGEHLPADVAPVFVDSLVKHAPAVLFSAAIPFQGGAGHVNEQWPSYWTDLFSAHRFVPVDVVRGPVWSDTRVAFWYAQNTILYVDEHHVRIGELREHASRAGRPLDLVHPALHTRDHTTRGRPSAPPSLSRVLRDLPGAAWRAVRRRTEKRATSRT